MPDPASGSIAVIICQFVIDFREPLPLIAPRNLQHLMAEQNAPDSSPIAEISHGPSAFETFLDNNQKKLIILGILIALGMAAWVVKEGIREGNYLSAGNALSAADDTAALEEVMENH